MAGPDKIHRDPRNRAALITPDGDEFVWVDDAELAHALSLRYRPATQAEVTDSLIRQSGNAVEAATMGLMRTATLGGSDLLASLAPHGRAKLAELQEGSPVWNMVGEAAGMMTTPAAIGKGVASKLGSAAAPKLAQKIAKVAGLAAEGGAAGLGIGAGNIAIHGEEMTKAQSMEMLFKAISAGALLNVTFALAAGGVRHIANRRVAAKEAAAARMAKLRARREEAVKVVNALDTPQHRGSMALADAKKRLLSTEKAYRKAMRATGHKAGRVVLRDAATYAIAGGAGSAVGYGLAGEQGGYAGGGLALGGLGGRRVLGRIGSRLGWRLASKPSRAAAVAPSRAQAVGAKLAKTAGVLGPPSRRALVALGLDEIAELADDMRNFDAGQIVFPDGMPKDMQDVVRQRAQTTADYVASKAPKNTSGRPGWRPTRRESRRFADTVFSATEVLSVLEMVAGGRGTKSHIEALQSVAPEVYSELSEMAQSALDLGVVNTPEAAQLAALILGDVSMNPLRRSGNMLNRLQELRAPQENKINDLRSKLATPTLLQGAQERLNE